MWLATLDADAFAFWSIPSQSWKLSRTRRTGAFYDCGAEEIFLDWRPEGVSDELTAADP